MNKHTYMPINGQYTYPSLRFWVEGHHQLAHGLLLHPPARRRRIIKELIKVAASVPIVERALHRRAVPAPRPGDLNEESHPISLICTATTAP